MATIPNRDSPPAILLRESYREKGKVKSRILANLSSLPSHCIDILRRSLKGENLVSTDAFEIVEDGSPALRRLFRKVWKKSVFWVLLC